MSEYIFCGKCKDIGDSFTKFWFNPPLCGKCGVVVTAWNLFNTDIVTEKSTPLVFNEETEAIEQEFSVSLKLDDQGSEHDPTPEVCGCDQSLELEKQLIEVGVLLDIVKGCTYDGIGLCPACREQIFDYIADTN